jgi:thymidylate synthase
MENNLDKQYTELLQDILDNGVTKKDRTGTGTLSTFGRQIRHKMSDGFPLLTTKKMPFRLIATELLWFLRGDTNIKFLVDNDCHIWDGDAYKNYCKEMIYHPEKNWLDDGNDKKTYRQLSQEEFINKIKTDDEFAKKWGELGPIYGKQWRSWKIDERRLKWSQLNEEQKSSISKEALENTHYDAPIFTKEIVIDQIQNLINDLKTNPDSRRLMVNAWNVGELDQMVLPPCHYGFQVYTRELDIEYRAMLSGEFNENTLRVDQFIEIHGMRLLEQKLDEYNIPKRAISLMWNQRSVDTFLGLPFNIASYGLLLEIIAKAVNMVPDELIGNLGDTHLYLDHIEQAKEQIGRTLSLDERLELWYQKNQNETGKRGIWEIDYRQSYEGHKKLNSYNIPSQTREPYQLPALKHMKSDEFYKSLSEDVSLFTHLDINDFSVEGYQSHPTIKAPLSN